MAAVVLPVHVLEADNALFGVQSFDSLEKERVEADLEQRIKQSIAPYTTRSVVRVHAVVDSSASPGLSDDTTDKVDEMNQGREKLHHLTLEQRSRQIQQRIVVLQHQLTTVKDSEKLQSIKLQHAQLQKKLLTTQQELKRLIDQKAIKPAPEPLALAVRVIVDVLPDMQSFSEVRRRIIEAADINFSRGDQLVLQQITIEHIERLPSLVNSLRQTTSSSESRSAASVMLAASSVDNWWRSSAFAPILAGLSALLLIVMIFLLRRRKTIRRRVDHGPPEVPADVPDISVVREREQPARAQIGEKFQAVQTETEGKTETEEKVASLEPLSARKQVAIIDQSDPQAAAVAQSPDPSDRPGAAAAVGDVAGTINSIPLQGGHFLEVLGTGTIARLLLGESAEYQATIIADLNAVRRSEVIATLPDDIGDRINDLIDRGHSESGVRGHLHGKLKLFLASGAFDSASVQSVFSVLLTFSDGEKGEILEGIHAQKPVLYNQLRQYFLRTCDIGRIASEQRKTLLDQLSLVELRCLVESLDEIHHGYVWDLIEAAAQEQIKLLSRPFRQEVMLLGTKLIEIANSWIAQGRLTMLPSLLPVARKEGEAPPRPD